MSTRGGDVYLHLQPILERILDRTVHADHFFCTGNLQILRLGSDFPILSPETRLRFVLFKHSQDLQSANQLGFSNIACKLYAFFHVFIRRHVPYSIEHLEL